MKVMNRSSKSSGGGARRSRVQHRSNLLLIVLAGLVVFNVRSFLFGADFALAGYTDFSQFYSGATIVRDGNGSQLYTYDAQAAMQKEMFATAENRSGPVLYYHPAFEILAFVPLTYTRYEV